MTYTINGKPATRQEREEYAYARRMEGATYKEIGEEIGVSTTRAQSIVVRYKMLLRRKQQYERRPPPFARDYKALPVRLKNAIKNLNIRHDQFGVPMFSGDARTEKEWLEVPNIGRRSVGLLKAWSDQYGMNAIAPDLRDIAVDEYHRLLKWRRKQATACGDTIIGALDEWPIREGETIKMYARRLQTGG